MHSADLSENNYVLKISGDEALKPNRSKGNEFLMEDSKPWGGGGTKHLLLLQILIWVKHNPQLSQNYNYFLNQNNILFNL